MTGEVNRVPAPWVLIREARLDTINGDPLPESGVDELLVRTRQVVFRVGDTIWRWNPAIRPPHAERIGTVRAEGGADPLPEEQFLHDFGANMWGFHMVNNRQWQELHVYSPEWEGPAICKKIPKIKLGIGKPSARPDQVFHLKGHDIGFQSSAQLGKVVVWNAATLRPRDKQRSIKGSDHQLTRFLGTLKDGTLAYLAANSQIKLFYSGQLQEARTISIDSDHPPTFAYPMCDGRLAVGFGPAAVGQSRMVFVGRRGATKEVVLDVRLIHMPSLRCGDGFFAVRSRIDQAHDRVNVWSLLEGGEVPARQIGSLIAPPCGGAFRRDGSLGLLARPDSDTLRCGRVVCSVGQSLECWRLEDEYIHMCEEAPLLDRATSDKIFIQTGDTLRIAAADQLVELMELFNVDHDVAERLHANFADQVWKGNDQQQSRAWAERDVLYYLLREAQAQALPGIFRWAASKPDERAPFRLVELMFNQAQSVEFVRVPIALSLLLMHKFSDELHDKRLEMQAHSAGRRKRSETEIHRNVEATKVIREDMKALRKLVLEGLLLSAKRHMYDDKRIAGFKILLDSCLARGLITKIDLYRIDSVAEDRKTMNTEAFRALRKDIKSIQGEIRELRNQNERQNACIEDLQKAAKAKSKRDLLFSVAKSLMIFGGGELVGLISNVIDLASIAEVGASLLNIEPSVMTEALNRGTEFLVEHFAGAISEKIDFAIGQLQGKGNGKDDAELDRDDPKMSKITEFFGALVGAHERLAEIEMEKPPIEADLHALPPLRSVSEESEEPSKEGSMKRIPSLSAVELAEMTAVTPAQWQFHMQPDGTLRISAARRASVSEETDERAASPKPLAKSLAGREALRRSGHPGGSAPSSPLTRRLSGEGQAPLAGRIVLSNDPLTQVELMKLLQGKGASDSLSSCFVQ